MVLGFDRKVIAEEFNNFFATVGERNGHTNPEGDCNFRDYLTHITDKIFSFCQIDNTATIRIIKNMKISQSKGHDGISLEFVKLINNDISRCIICGVLYFYSLIIHFKYNTLLV